VNFILLGHQKLSHRAAQHWTAYNKVCLRLSTEPTLPSNIWQRWV